MCEMLRDSHVRFYFDRRADEAQYSIYLMLPLASFFKSRIRSAEILILCSALTVHGREWHRICSATVELASRVPAADWWGLDRETPPEREKFARVHGGIKAREISVAREWRYGLAILSLRNSFDPADRRNDCVWCFFS
jgi:hypothetical protein